MTQEQLADLMGVGVITVCRWETRRPPTGERLSQLELCALRLGQMGLAELFHHAALYGPAIQDDDLGAFLRRVSPQRQKESASMNEIRAGDQLRVFPHGDPTLAATARVLMISPNQRSIAVAFADKPPFATAGPSLAIHPDYGVMLFALRAEIGGEPWGPWVELFGQGHFEMEAA
jgi:hypothetical protein